MKNNENVRAINEAVSSIMTLAILYKDLLHINIKYTAYINEIEVKVFNQKTNYSTAHKRKFSCCVYLDTPNVLNKLKSLESKLIDLINIKSANSH